MPFSNKLGIIAIVEWLGLYVIGDNYYTERVVSVSCLFLIIYTLFKSFHIKRYDIFIIFAFIFNYALVPYNYYFNSLFPGVRTEALDSLIIYKVSLILHLFVSVILAHINLCVSRQYLIIEKSDFAYKICIILGFVGTTFGLSGTNILESGAYYGGTTNYSSIYEYSIIPITLSLIYADTRDKRNITYILYTYFVIKSLLFGGRIATVVLLIAGFLIRWQYYWSKKAILIGLFLGMLFMSVWGVFRSNTHVDFADIFGAVSNFDGITQDGQYSDVFYASARVLYLIDIGILEIAFLLYNWQLCYFVLLLFHHLI